MKILILGGGYAGVACALRLGHGLRRARIDADVQLINPAETFVERIRLHQAAAGQRLRRRPLGPLLRRAGVRLRRGEVQALDPSRRELVLDGEALGWDRLVLALGSAPGLPPAGAHVLSPDQAPQIAQRLAALQAGAPVVVVGGGLSAVEAAAEIAESWPHLQTRLIAAQGVLPDFSLAARAHAQRRLQHLGVRCEAARVSAVEDGVVVTPHGRRPAAATVWATGFRISLLPRRAGLAVDDGGRVLVDPQLRVLGAAGIYAAGDIAVPVVDPGQPLPMGCKTAQPAGVQVARNLLRDLRGQVPQAFDWAGPFYCVSLGRRDGLIQFTDAQGRPRGRIWTGRRAAWFKEFICRMTWGWTWLESRGLRVISWQRTGRAPDRLPADIMLNA